MLKKQKCRGFSRFCIPQSAVDDDDEEEKFERWDERQGQGWNAINAMDLTCVVVANSTDRIEAAKNLARLPAAGFFFAFPSLFSKNVGELVGVFLKS